MRRVGTVALWLLATIGATALAWQAVGTVGVAASGDAVGTIVASVGAQTSRTNGDTSLTSPPATTRSSTTTTTQPSTATSSATPTISSGSTASTTIATAATPAAGTASDSATSTSSPSQTSPPTTLVAATTTQPPVTSSTQTFTLTGGSVTVSFSASSVTVVLAEPSNGFTTKDVKQDNPTQILVRFTSNTHDSRLRAWWLNGPQTEIRD